MKTTTTYWNPLDPANRDEWEEIEGSDGNLRQLTLAMDPDSGDYTRLTWFRDGYYSGAFGAKAHAYPEESLVMSGWLYDEAFDMWLGPGCYASRPSGEVHGRSGPAGTWSFSKARFRRSRCVAGASC